MFRISSRSGVATLRTAIHLLLTYSLNYMYVYFATKGQKKREIYRISDVNKKRSIQTTI